ncbi:Phr family secreted Rap phosphatase inhibitor [Bacillus cereus]|uniref:Phr family secreted Rap phosphatase inhibitor n=1 Tax=Bacillus TaxID=1386 RepID=UPI000A417D81|nr:Phr family secreted Rap phosphatase inhibitor [Bacillus sp. UNC322MFChir4.1]
MKTIKKMVLGVVLVGTLACSSNILTLSNQVLQNGGDTPSPERPDFFVDASRK